MIILAAAVGVSSGRRRGQELAHISSGALLLAFLVLGLVLYAGMRLFVHLVQAQLTP
ncbi:DUF2970 domain-containing protein [Flagellatimonas centrodinii]|uniref:DUF2970 domain-containing protein n=1 Tax=Flagellatimonas centrodinii TaxID=2806210 RepID=UPI001FFD9921|nr:DUF2970 domain-containing protein [Flagellatimonas centrodinii]ULQ46510.1 DUF2970 domain-containing protein [Flagellatimonas centrodinii]